jgi:Ala-tRNA(Pro) deacylase
VTTESDLFGLLDRLSIVHSTYRHPAVFTVAEAQLHRPSPTPAHSVFIKNLFIKNKKDQMFLLTLKEDRPVDLKSLGELCGATKHVSFCSKERLLENLGVLPGAVTPFSVMNDKKGDVVIVLDKELVEDGVEWIHAHPLHNEATTMISPRDLLVFLKETGHEPKIIEL